MKLKDNLINFLKVYMKIVKTENEYLKKLLIKI